jgi:predicted ATP-grasp superfamily ATP-dependent carboligase
MLNSKKFIFLKVKQGDHYKYVNLRYVCETPDFYLQIVKDYGLPYKPQVFYLKTKKTCYLYNVTNNLRNKNYPKTLMEAKQRIFDWLEKNPI